MLRRFALACALLCAFVAVADDAADFKIQGMYEAAEGPSDGALSAKVIATGKGRFRLQLIHSRQATTGMLVVEGKTEKDGTVHFEGASKMVPKLENVEALKGDFTAVHDGTAITGTWGKTAVKLVKIDPKSPTLGAACPANGEILYDGANLDKWMRWPEKWNNTSDGFEIAGSNFVTLEEFGSHILHLEFMPPFKPSAPTGSQERGNSGMYVHGNYEVQVLDSFGDAPADNLCGGIYSQSVPSHNNSYPPGVWQTYDVDYTAPVFDAAGKKTTNARITVKLNGETIHDDKELTDRTPGGVYNEERALGRLMLQDHHNNVKYRNIWIVKK